MKSNAKLKVTQKEFEKSIEINIPNEEADYVTAGIIKNNHLRNLYSDFCILNQEFLSYVVSCKLSALQLNMLILFMSEMNRENKILINNQILINKLGATEKTVIDSIKKLTDKKIIVRQKLGVARYEIQINYDILNPLLAFKNKATKENVKKHKELINQEAPYLKQQNIFGEIDMVNPHTGEIFYTISKSEASKHMEGTKKVQQSLLRKVDTIDVECEEETELEKMKRQLKELQEKINSYV